MKKEIKKSSNKKMAVTKELLDLTYPYKRQATLQLPTEINSVIREYPALGLVSEVSIPTQKTYFLRTFSCNSIDLLSLICKLPISNYVAPFEQCNILASLSFLSAMHCWCQDMIKFKKTHDIPCFKRVNKNETAEVYCKCTFLKKF